MGWLWLIVIILVVMWFLGLLVIDSVWVHVLLVIAVCIIAYRLAKS